MFERLLEWSRTVKRGQVLCWFGRHQWHVGAVYAPPVCRRCRLVCWCHAYQRECDVHRSGAGPAPLWPAVVAPFLLIALAFLFAWAVGK